MIKICSHPRSGTHFIEEFLARNIYAGIDLSERPMTWGHWSDRQEVLEGKKNLKLFGTHFFPEDLPRKFFKKNKQLIYIYRDGRAVAYSLWRSKHFLNKGWCDMSFSEFLHMPLDWKGGVGRESQNGWTVAEHWSRHVCKWIQQEGKRCVILRFEDVKSDPVAAYNLILSHFFPIKQVFLRRDKVDPVNDLIGLQPNQGMMDSWRDVFTKEDNDFFISKVSRELLPQLMPF